MIRFSKEKVKLLHQLLAEATGGSVGVRDEGLLDSALESAFSGFGDREFYPTKEEENNMINLGMLHLITMVQGPMASEDSTSLDLISQIYLITYLILEWVVVHLAFHHLEDHQEENRVVEIHF